MKKLLCILLIVTGIFTLTGCSGSCLPGNEPAISETEEFSQNTSSREVASSERDGDLIESLVLSDDYFELRQESITLEFGTPLSDDLSEYVIAKDYSKITCEYKEISRIDFKYGEFGEAIFTNHNNESLTMYVYYTDTTPPTITQNEATYYSLKYVVPIRDDFMLDPWYITQNHGARIRNVQISDELIFEADYFAFDYFGLTDNTKDDSTNDGVTINSVTLDGVLYEQTTRYHDNHVDIPCSKLDAGTHDIVINASDDYGNSASFRCTLNVVLDFTPEDREAIKAYGYTDADIDAAIEEAKKVDFDFASYLYG